MAPDSAPHVTLAITKGSLFYFRSLFFLQQHHLSQYAKVPKTSEEREDKGTATSDTPSAKQVKC